MNYGENFIDLIDEEDDFIEFKKLMTESEKLLQRHIRMENG